MLGILFSLLAGYEVSEWICGPWPNLGASAPPPPPLPEPVPEIPAEPDRLDNSDYEPDEDLEPRERTISRYGIGFDEDMKYIGD